MFDFTETIEKKRNSRHIMWNFLYDTKKQPEVTESFRKSAM